MSGQAGKLSGSATMNQMNWLSQWGPAIFMVITIWIGLIYNNKRLDDFRDFFKDLLRSEISGSEARLRTEIVSSEGRLRGEISGFGSHIAKLDTRVERLEEHRLVRP
jgi:hypothetical protein